MKFLGLLAVGAMAMSVAPAIAGGGPTNPFACENFWAPPEDADSTEPPVRKLRYVVQVDDAKALWGQFGTSHQQGRFDLNGQSVMFAFWSGSKLPNLFTTSRAAKPIYFLPTEGDGKSRVTLKVSSGYLKALPKSAFAAYVEGLSCRADGDHMVASAEADDGSIITLDDRPEPPIDIFGSPGPDLRESFGDDLPVIEKGKSLSDTLGGYTSSEPPKNDKSMADLFGSSSSEPDEIVADASSSEEPVVPADRPGGIGPPPGRMCVAENEFGVAMPWKNDGGVDSYTVGKRTDSKTTPALDYDTITGDIFDSGLLLGVGDTANQTMGYRPIAPESNGGKMVPIAVDGVDLSWVQASPTDPDAPAYRIAVFSAATELSMSGLDQVGAMAKASGMSARLEIVWYVINDDGSLGEPQKFTSLEDLVAAASAASASGELASLSADAFTALLGNVEKTISASPDPLHRVILAKGAYQVPATTPVLLQDMVERVGKGEAIARGPTGKLPRWLWIITARMPGFGVAYLKGPLADLEAGDVIDEPADNNAEPRRFIVDPKTWAAKLAASAAFVSKPSDPGPKIKDTLAINGADFFSVRGVLLSEYGRKALVDRATQLQQLTDDNPEGDGALRKALRESLGKDRLTVGDVLTAGPLSGIFLPRSFDGVGITRVDTITGDAKAKLSAMSAAMIAALSAPTTDTEKCAMRFFSLEQLGL